MTIDLKKPIPVLLTVRELDQGGIERDVSKVALHLDRSRFEPHVASFFAHGMRYEELRRAGVAILPLPPSQGFPQQALRICRYILQHKFQVVHCWDASGVRLIPLARLMRVPIVITSVLGNRCLLDQRSRRQWRFTDRMVDAFVVNCEAMRRHLIEDEGAATVRIELCYNGVDTAQFFPQQALRPEEVVGAPLVIGTVCALRPEKALDVLQEAFAQVRQLCAGMKLLIVGSGAELGRLRTNAIRLGIAEDCVFVPAAAVVGKYLRGIDIFVLPSHSEAFSNALLEAMASGCCPVGSHVGGTPEMLGFGEERGLLFPAGDAAQLAAKLELLIRNPELRNGLAKKAASHARNHLNLEANIRRMAQIYELLLNSSVRRAGSIGL